MSAIKNNALICYLLMLPLYGINDSCLTNAWYCSRVFTTSRGHVVTLDMQPAPAPAIVFLSASLCKCGQLHPSLLLSKLRSARGDYGSVGFWWSWLSSFKAWIVFMLSFAGSCSGVDDEGIAREAMTSVVKVHFAVYVGRWGYCVGMDRCECPIPRIAVDLPYKSLKRLCIQNSKSGE